MRPILLIMWTAFQSFILRDNNNGHWGRTGWCLSLPREIERSRPPESGVAPLASARNPLPPSLG